MQMEITSIQEYLEHRMEEYKADSSRDFIDGYSYEIHKIVKISDKALQDNVFMDKEALKRLLVDTFDDEHAIALMKEYSSCLSGLDIEMANGTFCAHRDILEYIEKA
jgi:hypothetical protein